MKELAIQRKSDYREKPALNVGSISQDTPRLDTKKQVQEEALLSAFSPYKFLLCCVGKTP